VEQLAMFRITSETCRAFTLAEVLIMAAMNVESIRLSFEGRLAAAQTSYGCHFLQTSVRIALQA
jgi:hypothetical protein